MNKLFFLLLFVVSAINSNAQTPAIPYGNNPSAGHYTEVNGIRLYCEIYGQGRPLLLLHGSGGSIRSQRSRIPYFQNYFKVIAVDSRSQGKSIDSVSKRLTYDQMADDIKIMMDSLHIDSAYVWGQSDGGILALILASKYPAKIARLSTFGANLFPGKKAIYDEIEEMVEDTLKTTNNFQTRRLFDLLVNEPHITIKDLKKISAPALIMVGDRDVIRPEHTQLIFNNIPNANLFVMPGATHSGSSEKPDLFNMVLLNFFLQPFSQKTSVEMFTGKKPAK
jgi:pimeloyl-ACP methyl ester carboxylesterase